MYLKQFISHACKFLSLLFWALTAIVILILTQFLLFVSLFVTNGEAMLARRVEDLRNAKIYHAIVQLFSILHFAVYASQSTFLNFCKFFNLFYSFI